jgi:foldase protein PrsA
MLKQSPRRNWSLFSVAAFVMASVCGCWGDQPPALDPAPQPRLMPATAPGPATMAPAAAPDQGTVMAMVNGQPVPMSRLYDLLVRSQGLETGIEIVASEIVDQEARKRGLSVTEEETRAEHLRMLEAMYPAVPESDQRERALAQTLAGKGWSRVRWDLICRRGAQLRKMVEPNTVVTDALLRAEYADQFGRKVVVRHIEVESLDEWERIRKLVKTQADFERLARELSKNPSHENGGLLPPLGLTGPTEIPDVIRQAALNLKEVGELSDPIKVGYVYHMLRAEQFLEPASAPFEQARDKLTAALRERLIRAGEQRLMLDLMRGAKYEFVDPTLRTLNAQSSPAK